MHALFVAFLLPMVKIVIVLASAGSVIQSRQIYFWFMLKHSHLISLYVMDIGQRLKRKMVMCKDCKPYWYKGRTRFLHNDSPLCFHVAYECLSVSVKEIELCHGYTFQFFNFSFSTEPL